MSEEGDDVSFEGNPVKFICLNFGVNCQFLFNSIIRTVRITNSGLNLYTVASNLSCWFI